MDSRTRTASRITERDTSKCCASSSVRRTLPRRVLARRDRGAEGVQYMAVQPPARCAHALSVRRGSRRQKVRLIRHRLLNSSYLMGFSVATPQWRRCRGRQRGSDANPQVVVVMGVAGTGKTTIGPLLAARLGVPYAEGDDFHPQANIDKMSAGIPPRRRRPVAMAGGHRALGARPGRTGRGGQQLGAEAVVPRPASGVAPGVVFLHLTGDRQLIEERMSQRQGHFMPTALLDSQFATLQPLEPDEAGVAVGRQRQPAGDHRARRTGPRPASRHRGQRSVAPVHTPP